MVFFRGLTGRHASLGFPRRPVRDIVRRRFDHLGPEETRPNAGLTAHGRRHDCRTDFLGVTTDDTNRIGRRKTSRSGAFRPQSKG